MEPGFEGAGGGFVARALQGGELRCIEPAREPPLDRLAHCEDPDLGAGGLCQAVRMGERGAPVGTLRNATPISRSRSAEKPQVATATGQGAPWSNRSVTVPGSTRPRVPRLDDPTTMIAASLRSARRWIGPAGEPSHAITVEETATVPPVSASARARACSTCSSVAARMASAYSA